MSNLRQLNRREPQPELAKALRDLADLAESGDIMAFAYVSENHLGAMAYRAWHGAGSYPVKMVGQLAVLSHAIVQRHGHPVDE